MSQIATNIATIALAIIGLAVVSVLVSNRANTSKVIGAGTGGFAGDLLAAESPVTGQAPSQSYFGATGFSPESDMSESFGA